MKDRYSPVLVLVLTLVVGGITAQHPQSNDSPGTEARSYGSSSGEKQQSSYNDPSFFPGYVKPLFSMKSAIQSALHRIDDGRTALNALKAVKDKLGALLDEVAEDYMDLFNLKCMVNWPAGSPDTTYEGPLFGDKCYIVSSELFDFPPLDYATAAQKCLSLGGQLAQPSLMPGSSFGTDLGFVYGLINHQNYWIYGTVPAGAGPPQIQAGGGFLIPTDFTRYLTMNNIRSTPPVVTATSGLSLVGPLSEGDPQWYIEPMDVATPLPYICEFRAVVDPSPEEPEKVLKHFRSSLMYKLFRTSSKGKMAKSFKKLSHPGFNFRRVKSNDETNENLEAQELSLKKNEAVQNPEKVIADENVEKAAKPRTTYASAKISSGATLATKAKADNISKKQK